MEMNNLIYKALSPAELEKLWKKKLPFEKMIKVLDYDDIIRTNNIDFLFNEDNKFIIFYPNYQSAQGLYGHYCALIKGKNNKIFFFDSYGGRPDVDQKRFSGGQRKSLYNEQENSLINLLIDSGYNVDYSHHKLQSKDPNVATCGRWSLTRCALSDLTNDQFFKMIKAISKKNNISPDLAVVKIFN